MCVRFSVPCAFTLRVLLPPSSALHRSVHFAWSRRSTHVATPTHVAPPLESLSGLLGCEYNTCRCASVPTSAAGTQTLRGRAHRMPSSKRATGTPRPTASQVSMSVARQTAPSSTAFPLRSQRASSFEGKASSGSAPRAQTRRAFMRKTSSARAAPRERSSRARKLRLRLRA